MHPNSKKCNKKQHFGQLFGNLNSSFLPCYSAVSFADCFPKSSFTSHIDCFFQFAQACNNFRPTVRRAEIHFLHLAVIAFKVRQTAFIGNQTKTARSRRFVMRPGGGKKDRLMGDDADAESLIFPRPFDWWSAMYRKTNCCLKSMPNLIWAPAWSPAVESRVAKITR